MAIYIFNISKFMEELRGLLNQDIIDISRVIRCLHMIEHEIRPGDADSKQRVASSLFALASRRPDKIDEDTWDKVKFFIYTFNLALYPPRDDHPPSIPLLSLETRSGPLFFITTLLLRYRKHNSDLARQLADCFEAMKEGLLTGMREGKWQEFYKRSNLFFARDTLLLCSQTIPQQLDKMCLSVLTGVNRNNQPGVFTQGDLRFLALVLRYLMRRRDFSDDPELRAFLDMLFRTSKRYSCYVLAIPDMSNFFNYWFMVTTKSVSEAIRRGGTCTPVGMSEVIDLFNENSKLLENDIPMYFRWDFAIKMFNGVGDDKRDDRMKIVKFICKTMDMQIPLDQRSGFPSLLDKFGDTLHKCFCDDFQAPLLFFCQNVIMALHYFVSAMKSIKAVQITRTHSGTISFTEQRKDGDLPLDIDSELFSLYDNIVTDNADKAILLFESHLEAFSEVDKKIPVVAMYTYELLRKMKDLYVQDGGRPLAKFYYSHLVKAWFKFRIYSCFRFMLLERSIVMTEMQRKRASRNLNISAKALSTDFMKICGDHDGKFWTDLEIWLAQSLDCSRNSLAVSIPSEALV